MKSTDLSITRRGISASIVVAAAEARRDRDQLAGLVGE